MTEEMSETVLTVCCGGGGEVEVLCAKFIKCVCLRARPQRGDLATQNHLEAHGSTSKSQVGGAIWAMDASARVGN